MSEYYQRKRNNPHWLPDDVYRQTLSIVKNYREILCQRDSLLSLTKNEREKKAAVLREVTRKAEAVEQTVFEMMAKYSDTYTGEPFDAYGAFRDYGVFCYYRSRREKDEAPCRRTWLRYRSEFVYKTAKKLNYF